MRGIGRGYCCWCSCCHCSWSVSSVVYPLINERSMYSVCITGNREWCYEQLVPLCSNLSLQAGLHKVCCGVFPVALTRTHERGFCSGHSLALPYWLARDGGSSWVKQRKRMI